MTVLEAHDATCWINGDLAETREHAIKKTDIKPVFENGEVVQFVFEDGKQIAKRNLQGPGSKHLKFKQKISNSGNSSTTQPYDLAQGEFVAYVRNNSDVIRQRKVVLGTEVFPHCTRQKLKDLQLYFVKWVGCQIRDNYPDIDLAMLATALKTRKPLPRLFLHFGFDSDQPEDGAGYLSFLSDDKKTLCLNYFLQQKFVIRIYYDLVSVDRSTQQQSFWHPISCAGKITFHNN
jgi:hypothetical protein